MNVVPGHTSVECVTSDYTFSQFRYSFKLTVARETNAKSFVGYSVKVLKATPFHIGCAMEYIEEKSWMWHSLNRWMVLFNKIPSALPSIWVNLWCTKWHISNFFAFVLFQSLHRPFLSLTRFLVIFLGKMDEKFVGYGIGMQHCCGHWIMNETLKWIKTPAA